jgi:hypothetical protein
MSFLINPFAFLAAGGDFESIATVTVGGGGAASIEFTSIPAGTYQHLQVRMLQKFTTASGIISNARMRFNSDTGNNYARHNLYGTGSSAFAYAESSMGYAYVGWPLDSSATTASTFSPAVIDLLDYASTSKTKTVRVLHGNEANNSSYGNVGVSSALWNSTSAVTTITLTSDTGNWAQHTTAALYGIKA